jgi:hypothetical protein
MPLPTATQFEPLRGYDADRDKKEANGKGVIPLCRNQLIKPPRLRAVSDFKQKNAVWYVSLLRWTR